MLKFEAGEKSFLKSTIFRNNTIFSNTYDFSQHDRLKYGAYLHSQTEVP
jgi:hypothetical protein